MRTGSRDWYWLRCAPSLVAAYGPVDVAAEPGGQVSLGATILGEYAAKYLPQGDQDHVHYRYRERQSQDFQAKAESSKAQRRTVVTR
jgi:hypothetical protein